MKRSAVTSLAFGLAIAATAWAHDWNGIAVDRAGNVFVVDADSERIWKVSPAGKVAVFIDSKEGRRIEHPHHLSIDAEDVLWLASG